MSDTDHPVYITRHSSMPPGAQLSQPALQRRAHTRRPVDLDVSIDSDRHCYAGLVENLSETGVFIATHLCRPIGEMVDVTIHLPGALGPIRAAGEVRWLRDCDAIANLPPGMGVEFVGLDETDSRALLQFLALRDAPF